MSQRGPVSAAYVLHSRIAGKPVSLHHLEAAERGREGGRVIVDCVLGNITLEGQNTRLEKSFSPPRVKGAVLEAVSQETHTHSRLHVHHYSGGYGRRTPHLLDMYTQSDCRKDREVQGHAAKRWHLHVA